MRKIFLGCLFAVSLSASNFQPFIDQEADISGLARFEPVFDQPPAVNGDGLLELKGFYPTRPSRVRFDLAYIYEAPEWRLVQINVQVGAEAD